MESSATKRDIAIILFRFLSIYSFVEATAFFSDKFTYFFDKENYSFGKIIQIIGPSALLLICGVVIWYISPMIASWISKAPGQPEKLGFSINDVHDLAFSAIGLFIIVNTIPDIIYTIGDYYAIVSHSYADERLLYATKKAYLVSLGIKFVLGIWLLIGSRGIVKIVRATRRN